MTNSSSPPCEVGVRVECGQCFGTVKYVGLLQGMSSTWLGVDWDNPERGRHDGSLDGVRYFTTRTPTSGSFVRPKKVNFGRSAMSSIESRYGRLEDEQTTKINQQKHLLLQQTMKAPFLEMVGFEKIFNMQSDFSSLKIVNLRNRNVYTAGALGATCPNIEELDLSRNLFVSWTDVFEVCGELKKLHWLNVSENKLMMPQEWPEDRFPNMRCLICGSMGLSWDEVVRVAESFPDVEELRVPYNKIGELRAVEGSLRNLKLLDLEGNQIGEWSEICKLGNLPRLEQLIMENVGLKVVEFPGNEPKVSMFATLRKISLVNNLIVEWRSVGELNRLQNLQNLKIAKNPFSEQDGESAHQMVVARIATLTVLNGVEIEPAERRGAEYDYIKKHGLEWLKVKGTAEENQFLRDHCRYLELIQLHGEPEKSELVTRPKLIKSSLVELDMVFEDFTIQRKVPPTLTVQKLMVLLQKVFCLDERPSLTYVSRADSQIEIVLDDEMKEIGLYSMQDGDKIIVRRNI